MPYHRLEHQVLQTIHQHRLFDADHHILVALSGGLDSMTLLSMLHRLHFNVAAAHVNFDLRGQESEKDSSFCEAYCRELQIPFHLKKFDTAGIAAAEKTSIQVAARTLRYQWFHELMTAHGYNTTATAHHLNDQAETVLLHLSDGKSAEALRGIPIRNGNIVRPLLEISRAEIEAYAREKNISWREDESNLTDHYKRNYFRHQVIPAIEKVQPAAVKNISRAAARLQEWNYLAEEMAEKILHPCFEENDGTTILHLQTILQHPAAGMLLWKALSPFGFEGAVIDQLLTGIDRSGNTFLSAGYCITADRDKLLITSRTQEPPSSVMLHTTAQFGHFTFTLRQQSRENQLPATGNNIALLDADNIQLPLIIRTWQSGDSFIPLGMNASKKLSDFFIDQKIPVPQKHQIPVVCTGNEILWIAGYRISDRFKITDKTRNIVIIEINKNAGG